MKLKNDHDYDDGEDDDAGDDEDDSDDDVDGDDYGNDDDVDDGDDHDHSWRVNNKHIMIYGLGCSMENSLKLCFAEQNYSGFYSKLFSLCHEQIMMRR